MLQALGQIPHMFTNPKMTVSDKLGLQAEAGTAGKLGVLLKVQNRT